MHRRIVEVSGYGRWVGVARGHLVVRCGDKELGSVPLADVAALVTIGAATGFGNEVLVRLLDQGSVLVFCDTAFRPVGWALPLASHHAQTERFRAQAEAKRPLRKRLWQALIRRKIRLQSEVLRTLGKPHEGLASLEARVRSGDPDNIEAAAARRYWLALFGQGFRRDREARGINACLNYGYAILRAALARAICATGLHPSLAVHHRSARNVLALADDLIEPLRPMIDWWVALHPGWHEEKELGRETRRSLVDLMMRRVEVEGAHRNLWGVTEALAASLARSFLDEKPRLILPEGLPVDEEPPDEERW